MDGDVEVQLHCSVSTPRMITSCHPYNCPIDPSNGNNNDQYFNITVVENDWFFHGTSCIHTRCIGPYFFQVLKSSIKRQVDSILSFFNVRQDFHGPTAAKILDFAMNMANNTHRDKKCLYMSVELHVDFTCHSIVRDDENYDEAVQESVEDHSYGLTPASESSIEQLKKVVKLEDDDKSKDCSICLEGFEDNKEVIRTPCSHMFHGTCIVNWLHQNHVCPLCRFQFPKSE